MPEIFERRCPRCRCYTLIQSSSKDESVTWCRALDCGYGYDEKKLDRISDANSRQRGGHLVPLMARSGMSWGERQDYYQNDEE